jgi:GTP cyclohydrolase I
VVNLYADLPHDFKGTHMSRFIKVFEEYRSDLSMPRFLGMLQKICFELSAETAYSDLHFPYFIEKTAPVSGQKSMMSYDCSYEAKVSGSSHFFTVGVTVPVQTVCPCSKAISEYGAHNQRGLVTLKVELGPFFWIEDLVAIVEESASSDLFTLLKREDEKFITERAYEKPRFVEDLVREVYLRVDELGKFPSFSVEAENFESIHNHSAYAFVEKRQARS